MKETRNETIKYMWRSEKNRLFMVLTTAFILVYSLFVLPNVSGDQEIELDAFEREMNGNIVQFEDALDAGLIVPNMLTGTNAYNVQRREYVAQRELLTALKQGDARRYIAIDYRPESATGRQGSGLEQTVYRILGYEEEQPYQKSKNQAYLDRAEDISFHVVHDRTSLQQIHLFLIGLGPVFLLIGLIFLISDVHVKDRALKTQKIAHPLKWQKYLWVQALTALSFVGIFYLFLLITFIMLNGILYGFGSLTLPIGFHVPFFENGYLNLDNYQVKTIGWFLVRAFPFGILLAYLFTRVNTLLSLWTRQAVVTMVIGMFLILFQFIYYGAGSAELAGIHSSYYPQTYIDFGKVITGRFEFQVAEAIPTLYSRGLFVLSISILLTEVLTYFTSKKITRQIFVS